MTALEPSGNAELVWLVEFFPWDKDASATTEIYLATHDILFGPGITAAPNREYDGRVKVALTRQASMHGRDEHGRAKIGGPALPSYGDVVIGVDEMLVDSGDYALWRDGINWDLRRVRILNAPRALKDDYANYAVVLDGLTTGHNEFGKAEISIGLSSLEAKLAVPLETDLYLGTGGAEGGADLKGKPLPFLAGTRRDIAPVLEDATNLWYGISRADGLQSVLGVWDGGAELIADPSNPPASGKYYLDAGAGRIRLAATPSRRLIVAARGAFYGNANIAADIVEGMLVNRAGFTTGQLDTTSFDALATDRPGVVGFYRGAEACDVVEAVDEVVNGALAWYTGLRDQRLRVGAVQRATATGQTHAAVRLVVDDVLLEVNGLTLRPEPTPPWRVELGVKPNVLNLTEGDLAGSTTAALRAFLLEPFRVEAAEDADILDAHPASKPLLIPTGMDSHTAAATLAQEALDLFGADATTGDARTIADPFALEIGDEIWIASDLYDLDAAAVVIAIDESAEGPRVSLQIWI